MKKNRTISFGYMMQNGEIQINPIEAATVQKIFKMYLDGSSLLAIANWMSSTGISYSNATSVWNKNMIKRILENEKYIGEKGSPAIIDKEIFHGANAQKKIKSTTVAELPEELQAIRSLTYCAECGQKLFRIGGNTRSEKWDCRNSECSRFHHRITDHMLIGVIINVLNTVIANPDLLDSDEEISEYIPDMAVTRQQNEINRLLDSPDVNFDKAKEEIFRLAELKYNCCTYSDKPQKTAKLREILARCEQQNTLNIGLLKSCVSRILVSHFCAVEIEFKGGVIIKNITERTDENERNTEGQGDSCESADK